MTVDLRFCTIISNDGITIFHRTFIEDALDEYLFSGFSSAMIAFSKELGDELSLIKMEKQTIFYHEASDDGFLILSITEGYDIDEVRDRIDKLSSRETLLLLLEGSKLGLIQNENEKFEQDLYEIFDIGPVTPQEPTEPINLLSHDDDYVPPDTDLDIPKTKSDKKKSLEEQLHDEEEIEEPSMIEPKMADNKSKDEKELDMIMSALEELDSLE